MKAQNNWLRLFSGAKCTVSFMERCITYIGEHAAECVKTNSFLNLSKDGIIKLISSDYVRRSFFFFLNKPLSMLNSLIDEFIF